MLAPASRRQPALFFYGVPVRKTVDTLADAASPRFAKRDDRRPTRRGDAPGEGSWHWGAMVQALCAGCLPVSPVSSVQRMGAVPQARA